MNGLILLLIVAGLGVLPAVALLGLRLETMPLAPLLGSALIATAGAAVVVWPVSLGWVVAFLAFAANAVAVWLLSVRWRRLVSVFRWWEWLPGLGLVAAVVWAGFGLVSMRFEWDARSIWFLHARMLSGGHDAFVANAPAVAFSHPDYPLLASAPIAGLWSVAGNIDYRAAQVFVFGLTAAATSLAALAVVRAAAWNRWASIPLAFAVAAGLFGVWGLGATNGYMDALCAALVTIVFAYGFLVERESWVVALAFVTVPIASMSKNEGLAFALIGVALLTLASLIGRQSKVLWWAAGALGWAALWPLAVRTLDIGSDLVGAAQQGVVTDPTFRFVALMRAQQGNLLELVAALAAFAYLLAYAGSRERFMRRGAFMVGIIGCWVVLMTVYVVGPYEIGWWIETALGRTLTTVRALAFTAVVFAGAQAAAHLSAVRSGVSRQ